MADVQLVIFKLATEKNVCEYGIPITKVQEIITTNPPTILPQVPNFVEGIINLRGKIIPIIDLKKRFALSSTPTEGETRSIVLEMDGQIAGIVVDEVSEVIMVPGEKIEPPPAVIGGITAEYLTGIAKVNDRLLILLDADRILTDIEKTALTTMQVL